MILLGLAADPLAFCSLLPSKSWSLSSLEKKTAVFIGTAGFMALKQPKASNRILIFDNKERSERLAGLVYISDIDAKRALTKVMAHKETVKETALKTYPVTGKKIDPYILAIIDQNKDKSFIHLYNTNIYGIKFKYTRDEIKAIYLSYLNSRTTREEFDRAIQAKYPRRGETKEAVDRLMELTKTTQFHNLREALQEVEKIGRDKVDIVAEKYKVEPFDLNYMIANIKETEP